MSHGLSLVPHVCVCDLLCYRTHSLNSYYSDLIARLCVGPCGCAVDKTGTVSFLHRPEVSHRIQIGVANPSLSGPGSLAPVDVVMPASWQLKKVVGPSGGLLGDNSRGRRHRQVRKPFQGCTAHERWKLKLHRAV